MADMLVPLLSLPSSAPVLDELKQQGVIVRRANPFEWTALRAFCEKNFAVTWADEACSGLSNKPVTTYIAIENGQIIGFGSYECTRRDFFGPTGVAPEHRGRNIGKALLLVCLEGLRDMGYAYAIIGGAGPKEFYAKHVGATEIPDSTPGVYHDLLAK
ncbi:MAG: GNAT family N-acetyltransferase [Armatimonadetes bacterium]|jgi:GNAT superfamily N-acetyltransferase|nr:GNAT family N-acetyltransferase [Armatimonadota bacterium]HOC32376.1 GNAT family N-acetyltransferase [Armatimonadota bacterium]